MRPSIAFLETKGGCQQSSLGKGRICFDIGGLDGALIPIYLLPPAAALSNSFQALSIPLFSSL